MDFTDEEIDACLVLLSAILKQEMTRPSFDPSYLISVLHALVPNHFSTSLNVSQLPNAIELYYEVLGKQLTLPSTSHFDLCPFVIAVAVQSPVKEDVIEVIMEQSAQVQTNLMTVIQKLNLSQCLSSLPLHLLLIIPLPLPVLSLITSGPHHPCQYALRVRTDTRVASSPPRGSGDLRDWKGALAKVERDLKRERDRNSDLIGKVYTLENELQDKISIMARKSKIIDQLESSLTSKNNQIQSIQSELNSLRNEFDCQSKEFASCQNDISILSTRLEDKDKKISSLEHDLKQAGVVIEELKAPIDCRGLGKSPESFGPETQSHHVTTTTSPIVSNRAVTSIELATDSPIDQNDDQSLILALRKLELYIVRRFILFKYLEKNKANEALFEFIPVLIRLLKPTSGSKSVVKSAASAVVNLCLDNVLLREAAVNAGVIPALIESLEGLKPNVNLSVIESLLWSLWSVIPSASNQIIEYSIVNRILTVLKSTFPCTPSLIRAACRALSGSLAVNSEQYWDEISPEVVVSLFTRLLRHYISNPMVISIICGLLFDLIKAKPLSLRHYFSEEGVESLLIQVKNSYLCEINEGGCRSVLELNRAIARIEKLVKVM
ncbi:hypothetical protein GEMRC1_010123 [Eukaryota sp. GEM-RC1]